MCDVERRDKYSYLSITKIEVNSFGVSDVKDAVGLGRKTGTDLKEFRKTKTQDHLQTAAINQ